MNRNAATKAKALRPLALIAGAATVALGVAVAPDASASASPVFPTAGVTYPNGAIVRFASGYYVLAGGRAFSLPQTEVRALRHIDDAVVVSAAVGASAPTQVVLRPGTLVTSNGVTHDPTIYVAGPGGELYGFASPNQLLRGGFDPALVVTVPGLGGLPVSPSSAGAAGITALSTRADGAIVLSGETYVFAAGMAFLVRTSGALAQLRTTDTAIPVTGTVDAAETSGATLPNGVLLSVNRRGVYVSYEGKLFPFSSMAQLLADGYGGTAAVPVAGTGGLPVIYP